MKGLIIKDFYAIRKIINTYLILTALLTFYCCMREMYTYVSLIPILILSTTIASTFSMDDNVKWNKIAISSPLSRKEIVKSKYILFLIIISVGILAGLVLSLPGLLSQKIKLIVYLELVIFATSIALCAGGLLIGFTYLSKSPIEKMELITVFSYLGAIIITNGINKLMSLMKIFYDMQRVSCLLINLIIMFVLYIFSYKLSVNEFIKRDI